jgi:hypothetical protein
MMTIREQWMDMALAVGDGVYRAVNTPDMHGTEDETGYILMFFNVEDHRGKSTFISSTTNKAELKKLLKNAIRELDGLHVKTVAPERYDN